MTEPHPFRTEGRYVEVDPKRVYKRRIALGLFEQGLSYKPVSDLLGVSLWTVRDWHREWRKDRFNVEPKPRTYSEEFSVCVLAEVKDPARILAVAKRWDVPYATLQRWYDRKVEDEEER